MNPLPGCCGRPAPPWLRGKVIRDIIARSHYPHHGYFHSFEKHLIEPLFPIHIYQPNEKGPLRTSSPNPLSYTWETQTQREGSFHHTGSCYEVSEGDLIPLQNPHTIHPISCTKKQAHVSHATPTPTHFHHLLALSPISACSF